MGGEGNDSLYSQDWFVTGGGADTLDGGAGDDFLYRQAGGADVFASSLSGGEGNDTLLLYLQGDGATAATAVMDGGAGNDNLIVDFASGGGGQQLQISGGDGADEINIQSANLPTVVDAGDGDDTVHGVGAAANHAVNAGQGADTVRLTLNSAASVTLGTGADRIVIDSWNGASAVTVSDFAAAEDKLDITSLLTTLQGWDGSNPFGARLHALRAGRGRCPVRGRPRRRRRRLRHAGEAAELRSRGDADHGGQSDPGLSGGRLGTGRSDDRG